MVALKSIKIKTWDEASRFLKNTSQIHTDNFDSMNEGENMPNLNISWHLELEHWDDVREMYDHFLIKKSRPRKAYPKVVKTDSNSLPGDDDEKMDDFINYMPGTRIECSWFIYNSVYFERCSFEFVGFKNFDSDDFDSGFTKENLNTLKWQTDHVIQHEKKKL